MHLSMLSHWGGGPGIGGGFDSSHRPVVGSFYRFNGLSSDILLTFSCYFDNPQMPWGGAFEQKLLAQFKFSTFLECSQMSGVFYHSVIHGLGFFICFLIQNLRAQNNKTLFFYDKTWLFDQSERAHVSQLYYNSSFKRGHQCIEVVSRVHIIWEVTIYISTRSETNEEG